MYECVCVCVWASQANFAENDSIRELWIRIKKEITVNVHSKNMSLVLYAFKWHLIWQKTKTDTNEQYF